MGRERYGEERQESQVEKAERVAAEEMKRRRSRSETLEKLAKGDVEKVKIAVRLRRETLATVARIGGEIADGNCGQRKHAAVSLAQEQRKAAIHENCR